MSVRSARAYEYQTETLFQGCQDAMQRAALAPLGRFMAGRDPAATRLLEVAAGTGRFHTFIKDNYPSMRTTCSDLSPYYLAEARENVEYFDEYNALVHPGGSRPLARTAFVQAAAEALPFGDAAFDVLMNVYLFHELPAEARAAAAREFSRVVAPGGLCVVNDSLQRGDRPEMDAVMPLFPANYHGEWGGGGAAPSQLLSQPLTSACPCRPLLQSRSTTTTRAATWWRCSTRRASTASPSSSRTCPRCSRSCDAARERERAC